MHAPFRGEVSKIEVFKYPKLEGYPFVPLESIESVSEGEYLLFLLKSIESVVENSKLSWRVYISCV